MIWRHLVRILLAVVLGSAVLTPAHAADITAALTEASKMIEKGGYGQAVEMIDNALRDGKVAADLAAKALLMRAEANEKLGRTAAALADYNSAIWMQSLSAGDRKRADEGHARVIKGLGVSAPKEAAASSSPGSAPAARPPDRSQNKARPNGTVQETASEQRTGGTDGIGGFFSNLFDSSAAQEQPQQPPQHKRAQARQEPPPTAAAATAPTPAERQSTSKAQPKKAADAQHAAPAAKPAPAPGASAKAPESGSFAIQLAAVAQEDKAIAETDRIAKKYGADLEGRTPSLMVVPTADGGTLYKVVLAPFETRVEGVATCEVLKTKGLTCMVITKK